MSESIPGPRAWPFIGNILDLRNEEGSLKALEQMAEIYGPIYQMQLGSNRRIVCSSAELMAELTDEKHFVKLPPGALANRDGQPAGLFVAANDDPDWGQAHRILVPAFGPLPIGNMFDGVHSPFVKILVTDLHRNEGYRESTCSQMGTQRPWKANSGDRRLHTAHSGHHRPLCYVLQVQFVLSRLHASFRGCHVDFIV